MTNKNGWHFVKGIKESHWVDLYYFVEGHTWSKAAVKWDGCIHLNSVTGEPYKPGYEATDAQGEDYAHICDLDEFIVRLQELRDAARQHFGEDWPR